MKMDEKEIAAELAEKYGMRTVEINMDDEIIKKYLEKIKNGSCLSVIREEEKIEMIDDERVRKLKEIALELLEKYQHNELAMIKEYSGNIEGSMLVLCKEISTYKERIEELTR